MLIAAQCINKIVNIVLQLIFGQHQFSQWEIVFLDERHQSVHNASYMFDFHADKAARQEQALD